MRNHSLALGLLGMMVTCPGLAEQTVPAAGRYRLSIPAEPLGDALSDLAQQTGLQVMFASKLVAGVRSSALEGTFSTAQALTQLLANTGLRFTFVNPRTVAINAAASGSDPRSSATPAPKDTAGSKNEPAVTHDSTDGDERMQKRSFLARLLGLFAICGSATHAGVACAQDTGAAAGSAGLEEVVVTAQKRSERLLDVPMSVAAISSEQLTSAGIGSTVDLQQITPGIVTTNNGLGFSPAIRGVSSAGTTPGDETNVAVYLDDVYLGAPIGGFFDLSDIERVEILKGPQGTLFGRNATGGAIRIVTRAPSFTPHANASADYGFDFEEVKLGGYVTGPIGERIAGSLSGFYRTGDGFVTGVGGNAGRRYGEPDNYVYRGKLLFQPSESFEATLAADALRSKNENVFIATPPKGVNPFPAVGSIANTAFHYAGSTQPKALVESESVSLDATWQAADWMTMRSITGYRQVEGEYQADVDRTSQSLSVLGISQKQENFSQEFNFSGPSEATFTWLLGAFYYHSKGWNPYFTVWVNTEPSGTPASSFTDTVRTDSFAGFGDLTWNATDQLHVTVGARYSTETKEYFFQTLVPTLGVPRTDEKTWESPTYRGVIRYDIAPDVNVYASWSNGFKSGVYNAYSPVGIPVSPEKIDAIEIGAKARIAGVTFTAAAYDYDYEDLQVQAHAAVNGVLVTTLTNAAGAKLRGVELTADGDLGEHLSFNIGGNWMPTAKYTDYRTASVVVPTPGATGPIFGQTVVPYDASGSRVIKAPEWTANVSLTYATALAGGAFAATISNAYSPGFYWQAGNLTEEPSYNVANLRLSWTDRNDRLTYSLWATNLTDELYSYYTTPNVRGNSNTYPQGRQIGIGIGADF